jgi:MYND finger
MAPKKRRRNKPKNKNAVARLVAARGPEKPLEDFVAGRFSDAAGVAGRLTFPSPDQVTHVAPVRTLKLEAPALGSPPREHIENILPVLEEGARLEIGAAVELLKIVSDERWSDLPVAGLGGSESSVREGGLPSKQESQSFGVQYLQFSTTERQLMTFVRPALVTLPAKAFDWFSWEYDYVPPGGRTVKFPPTRIFRQCPVCRRVHTRGEKDEETGEDRLYVMALQFLSVPEVPSGNFKRAKLSFRSQHRQRLFCRQCFVERLGALEVPAPEGSSPDSSNDSAVRTIGETLLGDTTSASLPWDYGFGTVFDFPHPSRAMPAELLDVLMEITRLKASIIDALLALVVHDLTIDDGMAILPKDACWECGNRGATFKCSSCGKARYCGAECQRAGWKEHKHECKKQGE